MRVSKFPKDIISIIDHFNHRYQNKQIIAQYNIDFTMNDIILQRNKKPYRILKLYNHRIFKNKWDCKNINAFCEYHGWKFTGYTLPQNY